MAAAGDVGRFWPGLAVRWLGAAARATYRGKEPIWEVGALGMKRLTREGFP
jgi:hypothetical protein